MKKIFFLFLIILAVNSVFSVSISQAGTEDPFYSILNFFREPIYSSLRCGKGAESATEQIFKCIFDILELLKSFAFILMVIAFFGAAIYLITTPFFGLKNIATAWKILTWTPVGIVILLLGDLIKDQIERIIFGP